VPGSVIRQKQVDGRTYKLKRVRSSRRGEEFEYVVTEDGGRVDDPAFSRSQGIAQFENTISAVKRASTSDSTKNSLGLGVLDDPGKPVIEHESSDESLTDFTEPVVNWGGGEDGDSGPLL